MRSTGSPTEMIQITVNGEARNVPADQSIQLLLDILGLPADRVAVELNKSIVRKRDWFATPIHAGAQLEIVEFVGGG